MRLLIAALLLCCVALGFGSSRFKLFPGVGYYLVSDYYDSWQEAANHCQKAGGHLAIVNSEAEANVLKKLLVNVSNYGFAYIGFHDLFAEGEFLTLFGEPLNSTGYGTWMGGKPNGGVKENCGSFSTDGGLHNVPCNGRLRSVCEQELWQGYEFVASVGYYKLYNEATSWDNARRICAQDGANLAIISSTSEYNTLQQILARYPSLPSALTDDVVFLGFHDIFNEGDFLTIFGGALSKVGYIQWDSGQPRNNTELNCGALTRKGRLTVSNCEDEYAFFCEHSLSAKPV